MVIPNYTYLKLKMLGSHRIITIGEDLHQAHLCEWEMKRPDFREGKSIESKCNKTVVDHITQILVEYHIHTTIISEYK